MTLVYGLFAMFVVLSVLDGITTYRALKRPGTREANPVMRWLFERFGIHQTLIVSKMAAIVAVWTTMGPYSLWVLAGVNAFYAWIAFNNYRLVK